jgi:hypothetical protein
MPLRKELLEQIHLISTLLGVSSTAWEGARADLLIASSNLSRAGILRETGGLG